MGPQASEDVTRLLDAMASGDHAAAERLFPLIYDGLHALAVRAMQSQRAGHTLQATALVHEAYLKLVQPASPAWESRAHFLRVAARAMRSVLIDHARARRTDKRGGGWKRSPLDDGAVFTDSPSGDVLALDEALKRLAALDGRKAEIVELRYFGGLEVDEAARVLSVSGVTIKREWRLAKAWLRHELERGAAVGDVPGSPDRPRGGRR
ncbi:MAG: sigma-70 family RNA polymerase sigma factor [Phycisphaerales bacterium]